MVAAHIEAKNRRILEYRKRAPGFEIWLLFATRFNVLSTLSVPRDAESWRFSSDFDRVVLSSWEEGVIDISGRREKE
jgi:hypothetical protein